MPSAWERGNSKVSFERCDSDAGCAGGAIRSLHASHQRTCPVLLLARSITPAHLLRCDASEDTSTRSPGELRGDGDLLLGVDAPEVSAEDSE